MSSDVQIEAHPMEKCSFLSRATVSWATPLLRLGSKQALVLSDVYELPSVMRATPMGAKFSEAFKKTRKHRVWKACYLSCGHYHLKGLMFAPLYIAASVLNPLSLKALIRFMNDEAGYLKDPFLGVENGWVLVAIVAVCSFGITLGMNMMFLSTTMFGATCRTAIMEVLYRKVFVLHEGALQQSSLGQIVTLTSSDLERIFLGTLQQNFLLTSPLLVVICLCLLLLEVEVLPAIVGFSVILAILPLNVCAARAIQRRKRRMLELTDARVRFMTEILRGIRIVKLHSWEESIENHIQSLRVKETHENTRVVLLTAYTTTMGFALPALIPFAMFASYVAMGNRLTVEKVFAVLAIMNVMRMPMQMIPRAAAGVMQALEAMRRIEKFLSIPEHRVGWEAVSNKLEASVTAAVDVDLQTASCVWGGEAEKEAVKELARTAPKKGKGKGKGKGKQTDPVLADSKDSGKSGSGTSFANGSKGKKGKGKGTSEAKATDHCIENGKGAADGSVADGSKGGDKESKGEKEQIDTSKSPVLTNISLRVPHGQKVAIVGRVAAGKSSLLYGMLGELEVSSGTIERISPIVPYCSQSPWIQSATLKENILFGLPEDAQIYQKAIEAAQLKPDLQILPYGDETSIGENGINLSGGQKARTSLARAFYACLKSGSPMVLLDDPIAAVDAFVAHALFHKGFLDLLKEQTVILTLNAHLELLSSFDRVIALESGCKAVDGSLEEVMQALPWVRDAVGTSQAHEQMDHSNEEHEVKAPADKVAAYVDGGRRTLPPSASAEDNNEKLARPLYEPEDRVEGRVQLHNYIEWARCAIPNAKGSKSGGCCLLAIVVLGFGVAQALRVALDVWCARWAENDEDVGFAISIYGALAGGFFVSVIFRACIFFIIAMRSCRSLHLMVLRKVLMAPINLFFDVTPSGRILNRFSSDLEKVDDKLPEQLFIFLQLLVQVLSSVVICIISSPFVIIGIPFIGYLFIRIVSFYQKSARELKRLDGISRSPMLQQFSESLKGLATIRAYDAVPRFVQKYQKLVDQHAKVFFTFWLCNRWLAMRVDFCAASLQCLVALVSMAWKDNVDPVLVGIALIWGFQLATLLQFTVRSFAEVENTMTGVERLVAYKHVPQEAAYVVNPRPTNGWPGGEIELRDISARYRPGLPLVLRGVSLHVFPGERVGICGRTGSGKSTMGLILFRIIEADSGQVLIDGRDTKAIGLQDLRQRMAMIPQEPIIFRMTVRENLDPFHLYKDEQIWKALELVCLDAAIRGLNGDLSFLCAEGGTNFSQGQMQLLCIARTLLQVPGIVMMDEATANIDALSDEIIQRTIRSHFNAVTVLTIAHRLSTIADSTKIAVFEKGELCEYGTPQELVAQDGALAAFFREAGIAADSMETCVQKVTI